MRVHGATKINKIVTYESLTPYVLSVFLFLVSRKQIPIRTTARVPFPFEFRKRNSLFLFQQSIGMALADFDCKKSTAIPKAFSDSSDKIDCIAFEVCSLPRNKT